MDFDCTLVQISRDVIENIERDIGKKYKFECKISTIFFHTNIVIHIVDKRFGHFCPYVQAQNRCKKGLYIILKTTLPALNMDAFE